MKRTMSWTLLATREGRSSCAATSSRKSPGGMADALPLPGDSPPDRAPVSEMVCGGGQFSA